MRLWLPAAMHSKQICNIITKEQTGTTAKYPHVVTVHGRLSTFCLCCLKQPWQPPLLSPPAHIVKSVLAFHNPTLNRYRPQITFFMRSFNRISHEVTSGDHLATKMYHECQKNLEYWHDLFAYIAAEAACRWIKSKAWSLLRGTVEGPLHRRCPVRDGKNRGGGNVCLGCAPQCFSSIFLPIKILWMTSNAAFQQTPIADTFNLQFASFGSSQSK